MKKQAQERFTPVRLLAYKAAWNGAEVIAVDPRHTSRTCSACGHVDAASRQTQAVFVCTTCGHAENADINAARRVPSATESPLAVKD